jgi:hypothetical protein
MYNDDVEYLNFLRQSDIVISTEVINQLDRLDTNVLNSKIDWKKVNRDYAINQISVIDDFLHPEFAIRLRDFMLFFSRKEDFYDDYAAVNFYRDIPNRVWFPILTNIVEEAKSNMECLRTLNFERAWSFIYDTQSKGVNIHADSSSVNLNLWVTSDESIVHGPNKNGLDIWKVYPPKDWDYVAYNKNPEKAALYLIENDAEKISVPYKFNRLIVFNSMFFHKTQRVTCKDGYENRRVNYTFLYR